MRIRKLKRTRKFMEIRKLTRTRKFKGDMKILKNRKAMKTRRILALMRNIHPMSRLVLPKTGRKLRIRPDFRVIRETLSVEYWKSCLMVLAF